MNRRRRGPLRECIRRVRDVGDMKGGCGVRTHARRGQPSPRHDRSRAILTHPFRIVRPSDLISSRPPIGSCHLEGSFDPTSQKLRSPMSAGTNPAIRLQLGEMRMAATSPSFHPTRATTWETRISHQPKTTFANVRAFLVQPNTHVRGHCSCPQGECTTWLGELGGPFVLACKH